METVNFNEFYCNYGNYFSHDMSWKFGGGGGGEPKLLSPVQNNLSSKIL